MLKEFLTLEELKKIKWEKIKTIQNRRFQATARYLLLLTAFYRDFFRKHKVDVNRIRSVEDWKKLGLPLIKKKLYLDRTRDFIVIPRGSQSKIFLIYLKYAEYLQRLQGTRLLLTGIVSKISEKHMENLTKEIKSFFRPKMPAFAGGTETGKPAPVLLTSKQKLHSMVNTADISAYLIMTRHFRGNESITGMNLFPYAPHIAWQVINMAAELRSDLNLCTAAGGFLGTEKLISIAKTAKPNVFSGMVDYLINVFLPQALEEGVKLGPKVVFLNGATKMLEIQRQRIKELFHELGAKKVIALDGYGASELKEATLAECEEGSGLHHVAPLSTIIRTVKIGKADPKSDYIYDWDFTSDEEGGYAAVWNIDGAGTLLQGFLLGDHFERVETGRCPHCGLDVKRFYNVNRISDLETEIKIMGIDEEKVHGSKVNLVALRERLLHIKHMKEVQLELQHLNPHDKLIVKYVPQNATREDLTPYIKEVFKKFCDIHPDAIKKISMSDLYSEKNLKYCGIIKKYHGLH
jgi:phenylacetate-CoA ligase